MTIKRVTVFMGHYGSGKTNVSVNFAVRLARQGKRVCIYDLDVVNPYFRTVDAEKELSKAGADIVASDYAASNVDIPAMDAASYRMTDDKNSYAVADVGGDDRGALALGRFSEKIRKENDYDALFVFNALRPETPDAESAEKILREIEAAGKLPFTGIVANTNLGSETTAEEIIKGYRAALGLSERTKLPVKFSAVRRDLIECVEKSVGEILPVDLIKYGEWL